MNTVETAYEDLLRHVRRSGVARQDRTGTGTLGIFGGRMEFDLSEGFPLVTTKRVNFRAIVGELLWFLSGSTNVKWLNERGIHIWDEWADRDGELGPIYGRNLRRWPDGKGGTIDQIGDLLARLELDPYSRRHVISTWNVADIESMALPPCHGVATQFYVSDHLSLEAGTGYGARKALSCNMYQRSADMFLGVPFNIASYALLTHILAAQLGYDVGMLTWLGGDIHIYKNHLDQVDEQLKRQPRPMPTLMMNTDEPLLLEYDMDDFALKGYDPHPAISAPVSV